MDLDRRKFLAATGATVASLSIAGCSDNAGNEGGNQPAGGNDTGNSGNGGNDGIFDLQGEVGNTPNYLEVTSFNVYQTADNVGVFGKIKNVGQNPVEDLEVEVTLRDDDTVIGEWIDTDEEERDLLRPGNVWRFNVVFQDENAGQGTGFSISADGNVVQEADR